MIQDEKQYIKQILGLLEYYSAVITIVYFLIIDLSLTQVIFKNITYIPVHLYLKYSGV